MKVCHSDVGFACYCPLCSRSNVRIAQVMQHWWFMAHWELVSSFCNLKMNVESLQGLQMFETELLW